MTEHTADPAARGEPRWDPFRRHCESRGLLDAVGDKWSVLIVLSLAEHELRYGQLAEAVDGISQKMLSQRLHGLVGDGLVLRTAHEEIPPKVVYELTDLGRSVVPALRGLVDWTVEHMDQVAEHRWRRGVGAG